MANLNAHLYKKMTEGMIIHFGLDALSGVDGFEKDFLGHLFHLRHLGSFQFCSHLFQAGGNINFLRALLQAFSTLHALGRIAGLPSQGTAVQRHIPERRIGCIEHMHIIIDFKTTGN